MKGTVLYGPGDVRFEERLDPKVIEPTDAILRVSAAGASSRQRMQRTADFM
jgi:threonine dehydrogenase-like Zn-dependent dehydrogenase